MAMSFLYSLAVQSTHAASLDIKALYNYDQYSNFSISPNGKYLAIGDNRNENASRALIVDLDTMQPEKVIGLGDTPVNSVRWATNNRLLVSLRLKTNVRLPWNYRYIDSDGESHRSLLDVGYSRMVAMDRDGSNFVPMMAGAKGSLRQNTRLDRITSILPDDPNHVLMPAENDGVNLYKVNIFDGSFEKIEDGRYNTYDYTVTRSGYPIARYDYASRGKYVKISVRADNEKKWSTLATVRIEDLDEFSPVGDTDKAGEIFVSARPEGEDRAAIYRYDLVNKAFLNKVASHPKVDINRVITNTSGDYVASVFIDHQVTYEFADLIIAANYKQLTQRLGPGVSVSIRQVSQDGKRWIVKAFGPQEPGGWGVYNTETQKLDRVANVLSDININNLGRMDVVDYTASDGQALSGYLTHPPSGTSGAKPLVVLVHGGPEARDYFDFEQWSQYLASNGFRVFQPQFRGSSGYGKAFAEAGYGQWGGLMQDDVTDGVEHLIRTGKATRGNICIIGASYGGYAALMGGIKTPDLYNCAASVNGVTDLIEMVDYDKDYYGKKSETYDYVKRTIGDPKADKARMVAHSPTKQAARLKIPVLLIHGEKDEVVPIEQAQKMRDAMKKSGNSPEYIELSGINHNLRGDKPGIYGERTTLENLRIFLKKHLKSQN